MMWGHAIGIYLLAGGVLSGVAQVIRAQRIASGEMKPYNLTPGRRWIPWVVNFFAFLLWPVVLVTFSIGSRRRRKARPQESSTSSSITGRRPLISKAAEEYTKSVLTKMSRRFQDPERGAPGEQAVPGLGSLGAPAEGNIYRCSSCGLMLEGFSPASTSEGWPLCSGCKSK